MDTPERSKIGGTPLSKFEDSPIFNFINNLSPIQPVKSIHGAQVFQSLSFASISSVFSSPHINLQKESRLSIRHPYSDSSKLEISSDHLDESNLCRGISNAINPAGARANCETICALNEADVNPPEECSTQPSNFPQPIQYDCGSPNHNTTPFGIKIELKLENGQTPGEASHAVHDGVEKRKVLFTTEFEFQEEHQVTQNKEEEEEEEAAACDWENLISVDADDLLIFDSSTDSEACKEQEEKFENNGSNSFMCPSSEPVDFDDPCLRNAAQHPPQCHSKEVIEEHMTDHTPQVLSGTFQTQMVLEDQYQDAENGNGGCISVGCKVESQQQRGMRRRCLTFDLAGGHMKNSSNNSSLHPAMLLPTSRKYTSNDKRSKLLTPGSSSSSHRLPGIGLHLNALATTPNDRMGTTETLGPGKRLIHMPCSISPFPPLTAGQKSKSLDVEKDECFTGSEARRDLKVTHDDISVTPDLEIGQNISQGSPKKKKRKSENGSENEGCKRCNCKKSKCLKLYCECFAAGIYCVEPCSCQGCFNKPIHEETVLATRKQIESRNPLAFAPKVIRASEPVEDIGEETNKTPASARHKRGCNCKKSGCLKKYCECFQGGVGCSPSCRCEGCKNAFGRKDTDENERGEEVMEGCEKQPEQPHDDQQNDIIQIEPPGSESILPITPSFEICRSFIKPPFLSSGKPPRSSTLTLSSSTLRRCELPLQHKIANPFKPFQEDDTPEILRGDASPNNSVKTISPNGKRVSPPCRTLGISPNRKGGRKLILKSIPSFPSLITDASE